MKKLLLGIAVLALFMLFIIMRIGAKPLEEPQPLPSFSFTFTDESGAWDIKSVDRAAIAAFAARHGIDRISLTLVDTNTLPVCVAWPSLDEVRAQACARCEGTKCYVSVVKAASAYEASLAASAAFGYAIQEIRRPKTREAWDEESRTWNWERFIPLIDKEGEKWVPKGIILSQSALQ